MRFNIRSLVHTGLNVSGVDCFNLDGCIRARMARGNSNGGLKPLITDLGSWGGE